MRLQVPGKFGDVSIEPYTEIAFLFFYLCDELRTVHGGKDREVGKSGRKFRNDILLPDFPTCGLAYQDYNPV